MAISTPARTPAGASGMSSSLRPAGAPPRLSLTLTLTLTITLTLALALTITLTRTLTTLTLALALTLTLTLTRSAAETLERAVCSIAFKSSLAMPPRPLA